MGQNHQFRGLPWWSRVEQTWGGCWEWRLARTSGGYGQTITRHGRKLAHRVAYQLAIGPIPEGMNVLHRCDNPPCCNPAHLFLGTPADNMADMVSKGRQAHGHLRPESKFGPDVAKAIARSQEAGRVLASRYGVSESTVCEIRRGRKWREVTGVTTPPPDRRRRR